MRTKSTIIILILVAASCGGTAPEPPPADPATTTGPTATVPDATTTSSTAAPGTTAGAGLPIPLNIPRLESGLPATFVGVTEGWEAVEVDTASGDIVRSIGQMERPGEADDEGGVFAAIDQVWRTSDHLWYIVSECCEPAAGMIHFLDATTRLTSANHDETIITDGWTIAPSPFDGRLVKLGYSVEVAPVGVESEVLIWLDQPGGPGFADGAAAWDRTGTAISWLSHDFETGAATLLHLDVTAGDDDPTMVELAWVGSDQWLDGMGTQESGNHVAFLNTRDDTDPEAATVVVTEGVVFSAQGELIATFPVETGSRWGSYDPSGRMLIYTDADFTVRWQGLGQSGVLAEGFVHVSW